MAEKYFTDDPIESADQDQLGRVSFSGQVVKVCHQVASQSKTTVMALIGPWGSGKSSVLELVTGELAKEDDKWKVVKFNPWLFSDIESLLTSFFGELGAALPKGKAGRAARKAIGEYVEKISPLGKLGALVGVDFSTIAQRGGEWLKGESSTEARRAETEKILAELPYKILVVVDDLDRLQPVELLQIFKLIRLVGRFPNVHYLLAYDERTILDLLGRSDLAYASEKRAQDYIQKIVQIRLDLPPMHDDQQSELVDSGLNSFFNSNQVTLADSELHRFGWMYHNSLKGYLLEPRAINRFMAQLHALYPLIHGEINVIDFLALTFLRTFEPNLYKVLPRHREALTGSSSRGLFSSRSTPGEKEATWRKIIEKSGVPESNVDPVFNLLSGLFPRALAEYGTDYDGRQRPVSSPDYFDRYFQFGVPSSDLPDAVVARSLSLLPDYEAPEVVSMIRQLGKDPARLLRKIQNFHKEGLVESRENVYGLLSSAYELLPPRSGFTDAPDLLLLKVADELLTALDPQLAAALVEETANRIESALFSAELVRRAIKDGPESKDWRSWAGVTQEHVISSLASHIEACGVVDIEELGRKFGLIYRLYWMTNDDSRVRDLVWKNINEGSWTVLGVLGKLVGEGISSGKRTLFGLESSTVDVFLGIDRVIADLGPLLEGEVDRDDLNEEVEATKENKEKYVLAMMKLQKQKRSAEA